MNFGTTNDYISALLIGLTYGNLWVCALLVFSLQTTKRSTSIGFLIGRTAAILALSVVVTLIGRVINIPFWLLHLISGTVVIGYAVYTIVRFVIMRKKNENNHPHTACVDDYSHSDCQNCPIHQNIEYHKYCDSCGDETCLYETSEFRSVGRRSSAAAKSGFFFGVTVGALRGGVLCSKLLILAPILTRSSLLKSMIISIIFILSSSIYPILGLFVGKAALRFVKFKKALIIGGAAALILVGGLYIWQGIAIIVSNLPQ
ncbi:MAG: hypothetical protein II707_09190 [Spirochaetales bacterium]|nr:hypothetical protein [Spirochaetales bacterium]